MLPVPSRRSGSILLVLLTVGSFSTPLLAQRDARAAMIAAIDSIARTPVEAGQVAGMSVAVVRGADTLVMRGYGYADLEFHVPTPDRAIYEIGSVTKQFTAAAVLQLAEQGRIDLDADITEYLPEYPTRSYYIPVRRLLDHTSGIRGYTEIAGFSDINAKGLPRDSLVELFANHPFDFVPGEAMIYNNSAYFLAGLIIEQVTGQSYAEYVQEHLFKAAGMLDSHYCSERTIMTFKVHGYDTDSTGLVHKGYTNHLYPYAAGSLCSTVGDLVAWNRALHGGRLLGPESYRILITPEPLNDGTELRYAKGLAVNPINGQRALHHGGGIFGFLSELQYYPDQDLSVVVLINTAGPVAPGALAASMAQAVIGRGKQVPTALPFDGDLGELVGRYAGQARGQTVAVTVTLTGDTLTVTRSGDQPFPVRHIGDFTFTDSAGVVLCAFKRESGRIAELRLDAVSGHYVLLRQVRY